MSSGTLSNSALRGSFLRQPSAWLAVDWISVGIEAVLLSIGVAFIYGAGIEVGGDLAGKWHSQLHWAAIGIAVYLFAAVIDYRQWCRYGWFFYLCGVLLLIYTLIFGKTINNTRGWVDLPVLGRIQPVEAAKPATVLLLAWLGTRPALRHTSIGEWLPTIVLLLSMLLPFGLICLQPDFGTAMVLVPVTLTLIFLTGLKWRWFFLAGALAVLLSPFFYLNLKPYQQDRVKVFIEAPAKSAVRILSPLMSDAAAARVSSALDAFLKPSDGQLKHDDWNAVQSLLAVGSGGMFGKGYLKGTQHVLGYLPKTIAPTDFIFSVIAEETGFIGAGTLLVLLAWLMLCFCRTAVTASDTLGVFLVMGITALFTTHIIVNISMTIQAAPIVGLPLPFVSYGGSFMLGTMFLAGVVQSVQIHRAPDFSQEETE